MNIAIGKVGKSILFNKNNWGFIGGDAAPSLMYINFAKAHPEHTLYLIGKSDFSRTRKKNMLSLPENIIDIWENKDSTVEDYLFPYTYFSKNKIKIDCGMFFMGPTSSSSNIPNYTMKSKPLRMFANYAAPIIHFLNSFEIPYFFISEDPRYIPPAMRDLYHFEKFVLSQYNAKITCERITKENILKLKSKVISYKYSRIETLFLLGEKKKKLSSINKTNSFRMFLHGDKERFKIIKNWFIDTNTKINIFGKWDEEILEKYPEYFRSIPMSKMNEKVLSTKYTFILGRRFSNFTTQKYWEMINLGIVPFIHPSYDSDRLLPIPEFLRVKDVKELKEKIKFLQDNDKEYKKILAELDDSLKEEYYDGTFINKMLEESIQELFK